MKIYRVLPCGCKFGEDNNEDVIYCGDGHKTWDDVKHLIGAYLKNEVMRMVNHQPVPKEERITL